jgi:hypothetical protein
VDVVHPIVIDLNPPLRDELDVAAGHGVARRPRELRLLYEPLQRKVRLHDRLATVAYRERDFVGFRRLEQSLELEVLENGLPAFLARQAAIFRRHLVGHTGVLVDRDYGR